MRLSIIGWMVGIVLVGFALTAGSHEGGNKHQRAQYFHFDYNAEHGVYCAWRHSYEGISCVKVGD